MAFESSDNPLKSHLESIRFHTQLNLGSANPGCGAKFAMTEATVGIAKFIGEKKVDIVFHGHFDGVGCQVDAGSNQDRLDFFRRYQAFIAIGANLKKVANFMDRCAVGIDD